MSFFKKMGLKQEVIDTEDKKKKAKREWEDSLVKVWRKCSPIAPKMTLDWNTAIVEVYASTVGQIIIRTPFWRGRLFTDSIDHHEYLHWSIYPLDLIRGLNDLTRARSLLMDELRIYNVKKLPYKLSELQFIQNILGDYLVHLQIKRREPKQWEELWKYLLAGGKWSQKKIKTRDTAFQMYVAAYHYLMKDIPEFPTKEFKTKQNAQKIAGVVKDAREGKITKAFAVKELAKIFHSYIERDEKEGDGQDGDGEEPKCPKCQANDWEILEVLDKP